MLRFNRTQATESGTGVRDGWLGEDARGLSSGRGPDLIRTATTCGILSTVSSTAGGLWRRTQHLLGGRFLPPTTCFAILSGLFCLRPVYTLVREGCRNLVVTLWKLKMLFCKSFPADAAGCQGFAPPLAHATINLCGLRSSVHEPAHANVHHNPQGQEHEQY